MTFNINLIFKLIFLFIFFLLTIFLLYQEILFNKKYNLLNSVTVKHSSVYLRKSLKDLLLLIIPSVMAYHTYFRDQTSSFYRKIIDVEKEIKELKAENKEFQESLIESKNKALSLTTFSCSEEIKIIEQKESQTLNSDELNKLNNLNKLEKDISENNKIIAESQQKIHNYVSKIESEDYIKKSGFILSDFDFQGFISSLSKDELLAFSGLLLNTLVLNYTVSIILIIYGEYLIKRFDLENKYPKLHKFIKIRRQLQNYYLKLCFAWIFIGLLLQIFVYICILYPKLIELF